MDVYEYLGDDHWTAASAEDGITWVEHSLPKTGLAGGTVQRATPCTSADGAAPARFAVVHAGSAGVGLFATEDEGLTWSAVEGFPEQTSEPRCVLSGDQLYIAGNDGNAIYLRAGAPGASSSWLLDKNTFQYGYVFRDLGIAVDSGGRIHLGFYTHANDVYPAEGYRTLRLGASPGSPFTFTFIRQPLDVQADVFGPAAIGEYTGLATGGKHVYSSYADNSSGTSHIAFHRTELPPIESNEAALNLAGRIISSGTVQ